MYLKKQKRIHGETTTNTEVTRLTAAQRTFLRTSQMLRNSLEAGAEGPLGAGCAPSDLGPR